MFINGVYERRTTREWVYIEAITIWFRVDVFSEKLIQSNYTSTIHVLPCYQYTGMVTSTQTFWCRYLSVSRVYSECIPTREYINRVHVISLWYEYSAALWIRMQRTRWVRENRGDMDGETEGGDGWRDRRPWDWSADKGVALMCQQHKGSSSSRALSMRMHISFRQWYN